jgi:hypothetical protein
MAREPWNGTGLKKSAGYIQHQPGRPFLGPVRGYFVSSGSAAHKLKNGITKYYPSTSILCFLYQVALDLEYVCNFVQQAGVLELRSRVQAQDTPITDASPSNGSELLVR